MKNNQRSKTAELALNGLLIAIVFISTYFIQFQLPFSATGGLVHVGNVALFTIAIVFGPRRGAIAGAFGMGLFDILSGWFVWAPFTFIVRGVMGFIIGMIAQKGKDSPQKSVLFSIIAILVSSVWMIAGYYATEVILYGNLLAPLNSVPGNITQITIGLMAAVPLSLSLRKLSLNFDDDSKSTYKTQTEA